MKPIALHPASVLIGLALAAVVVLATSAQTVVNRGHLVGYVPAEQWTYIQLSSDGLSGPNAYTVPIDRRLVVTRVASGFLAINGDSTVFTPVRLQAVVNDGGNTRVVLQPGDLVQGSGSIWGYLEPL